jgi:nickel-dependent lactate racemase
LIVSDSTRNEPREAFVAALRARLSDVRLTLAIATGTHGPARIDQLGLSRESLAGATIVNHDGHDHAGLVDLGTTSRGTPIRVHRCLVDTDLVIATGCIRPHYFAGFGAGVKALFPGLGEAAAIRANHRLKAEPGARAGIVVGNPCREDLEEAVARIPTRTFLVNGVMGPDERVHAVVAGDLVHAFREGVALARPWFTVRVPPAPLVIASDRLPVTATLYQAAKIAAAAAPLVEDRGTLAIVAECRDGTGPLDTVNEAIFRTGVLPRLAAGVRLVLVSSLEEAKTRQTLLDYAPDVDCLLPGHPRVVVIPSASQLLCEPLDAGRREDNS